MSADEAVASAVRAARYEREIYRRAVRLGAAGVAALQRLVLAQTVRDLRWARAHRRYWYGCGN